MKTTWYTADQVAEMLEMHPKTIRKYIREGKLKAQKVGKNWRISGHDLSLFMEGEQPQNNDMMRASNEERYSTEASSSEDDMRIKVSTVVDLSSVNKDEASRLGNMLVAITHSKDPAYGKSTLNVQYFEKDEKLRIMIWGTLAFTEIMLGSIKELTEERDA